MRLLVVVLKHKASIFKMHHSFYCKIFLHRGSRQIIENIFLLENTINCHNMYKHGKFSSVVLE